VSTDHCLCQTTLDNGIACPQPKFTRARLNHSKSRRAVSGRVTIHSDGLWTCKSTPCLGVIECGMFDGLGSLAWSRRMPAEKNVGTGRRARKAGGVSPWPTVERVGHRQTAS